MYGSEGYTHVDMGKAMTLYYTRLKERSLLVQHIHWHTCITSEYNNLTTHLRELDEDFYNDFSIVVIFRLFLVVNDYPFHCTIPVDIKLTLISSVRVWMRTWFINLLKHTHCQFHSHHRTQQQTERNQQISPAQCICIHKEVTWILDIRPYPTSSWQACKPERTRRWKGSTISSCNDWLTYGPHQIYFEWLLSTVKCSPCACHTGTVRSGGTAPLIFR